MERTPLDRPLLRGTVGRDMDPMLCLRLGMAFSGTERAALGWAGGDAAVMLARALGAGLCAVGCTVLGHDAPTPAAAKQVGEYYELPLSLFVEQQGEQISVHCFGRAPGTPAGAVEARRVGSWERLRGISLRFAHAEN